MTFGPSLRLRDDEESEMHPTGVYMRYTKVSDRGPGGFAHGAGAGARHVARRRAERSSEAVREGIAAVALVTVWRGRSAGS
jgi:hypothetical protein